jgi:hypothetical protein
VRKGEGRKGWEREEGGGEGEEEAGGGRAGEKSTPNVIQYRDGGKDSREGNPEYIGKYSANKAKTIASSVQLDKKRSQKIKIRRPAV